MESTYFSLASKNTFNKALRHFFKVNEIVEDVEERINIADIINEELENDEIVPEQILPFIGSIIRDKFNYSYCSINIPKTITEFDVICEETAKWSALDIILVYFNPNGKVMIINPKNRESIERAREFSADHLIVVYAKYLKGDNVKIEMEAIKAVGELVSGKDVFVNKQFIDQTVSPVKVAPKEEIEPSKISPNITPKYDVQVSNELFHNGNVEAWKKIIESYKYFHRGCEVHIFHEGEVINDINSLFKWGKVKHGDSIFFQVSGEKITDVSKLKKYLYEGASPRFEQFLKIGIGQILKLF